MNHFIKINNRGGLISKRVVRFGVMFLAIPLALHAQFKHCTINDYIAITGYTGSDTNIVIPSTLFNMPVGYIRNHAFSSCKRPTTITISENIKYIGDFAFSGCHLTAIEVSTNNTNYSSKEGVLFDKSQTTLIHYPKWKDGDRYVIPNSVGFLKNGAFDECTNLVSIAIPESVTNIGNHVFNRCIGLRSLTIPASVMTIGDRAFDAKNLSCITVADDNPSYTSVDGVLLNKSKTVLVRFPIAKETEKYEVPSCVTQIDPHAFDNCMSLAEVTLAANVTNIGSAAFIWCRNLKRLNIPSGVTSIGEWAFATCDNLEILPFPTNVTTIAMGTFSGCKRLKNIVIAECVTSIGERAFDDCRSMSQIVIPEGVTNIGEWAFSGCEGLTNVVIKSGIAMIAPGSFSRCRNLVNITFPESLTLIGYQAFYSCSCLENITIPPRVIMIQEKVFESCDSLKRVLFLGNAPEFGVDVFSKADNVTVYYLPSTTGWPPAYSNLKCLPWKQ